MPRKCTICKIIKDESKFNEPKINKDKEVGLTKSCKKCNLEINGDKKRVDISEFVDQKRW